MASKSFVVYGLGKFGYSVAVALAKNGCEVLAVDIDGSIVEDIAHAEVLKKVGADQTILPEREMGSRVARNMVFGKFMDTFELSVTYSMAELEVPESWIGKSLRELDVRGRYGINVIAAHEGDRINANLDPDEPLAEHQIILIVGNNDDLKKVK